MSDSIIERERMIADKMGWTHLGGIRKDDGWDMVTPDGGKIAIRFDEISLETGAHYLELEQRSDRDSKWKASGFGVSRKNADWWVMANSEKIYVTSTKKLWAIVKKAKDSDERHSRRNLEDPDKRLFSRAHIISLEDLATCSTFIINQ